MAGTKDKTRTRVSYAKETRSEAKAKQAGLVTVSITMPNGDRVEAQGVVGSEGCVFAKWVAASLFCEEIRRLPDLGGMLRELMEKHS